MSDPSSLTESLLAAVAKILRPLVRVLLRNRVASDAVTELVRRVYVDVAFEEFGLEGRQPTQSRVSILTGLNRKEVARLRSLRDSVVPSAENRRNRAAALLSAWRRDPEFLDETGAPLPLPFAGDLSFSVLCQRHSGDMKARSLADELLAAGALREIEGMLTMTSAGYVPRGDAVEIVRILGSDTAELVATIDHNLCAPEGAHWYQSKVKYDSVPEQHVQEFLRYSGQRAQELLEDLDQWLAARAEDSPRSEEGETPATYSLGLAAFQIVEPTHQRASAPTGTVARDLN